jgi:HK97 family phage major capsid protein
LKKFIEKMLATKKQALATITQRGDASQDINEVRSLVKQADEIRGEVTELETQLEKLNTDERGTTEELEARGKQTVGPLFTIGSFPLGTGGHSDEARNKEHREKMEARGADLLMGKKVIFTNEEIRAVTIASSNLSTGVHLSPTIAPAFNQVSSLVDMVNGVPLIGASSHEKSFEISTPDGAYRANETAAYSVAETIFDKVNIPSFNITAYAEISKSANVLTPLDYQSRIAEGVRLALRKKMAKEIIIGSGSGQLTGIYNAPINVMPVATTDILISAIDNKTLDQIVFGYGGDEDVELGSPVLILSKADLAAFAAIKTTTGESIYKITLNGNTGTISSDGSYNVKFVINSSAVALSATATAVNAYTMIYGNPYFYEMPIFSQIDVQMSNDFKFSTGMTAFRADVYAGGNVGAYRGFSRIKKVAAV